MFRQVRRDYVVKTHVSLLPVSFPRVISLLPSSFDYIPPILELCRPPLGPFGRRFLMSLSW